MNTCIFINDLGLTNLDPSLGRVIYTVYARYQLVQYNSTYMKIEQNFVVERKF